jgi:outer membrane protein OmpA-like peptidoglycan-associated protein
MANETNSPKRKNWIIWLIVLIILVLIGFYVFSKRNTEVTAEAASDSSTIESTINNHWTGVDPNNLPEEEFDELKDTNLAVRGNDQLAVYSLDETIVFDVGDTAIKPAAEEKIKSIMRSAEQRFPNGAIRIYGYADASGDAATNKKLAESRAGAVRSWILKNTRIPEERISINPVGEAEPIASNDTKEGRQKNRRVEIAVRKK